MVAARPGMRIRHQKRRARDRDEMTLDLAIIGAGPAGMAAAALAAELGLDTLLDRRSGRSRRADLSRHRACPGGIAARRRLLWPGASWWRRFAPARRAIGRAQPCGTSTPMRPAAARCRWPPTARARRSRRGISCIATGAIERAVPIPGWTLPGVMTVGAAQILLKTADIVPEGRAVLAGQGPLLYLTALQLARAGAPPLAGSRDDAGHELSRRDGALCRRIVERPSRARQRPRFCGL